MFILLFLNTVFLLNFGDGVILHTKQGPLDGSIEKSRGGRPFYAFYNIPYAEPPFAYSAILHTKQGTLDGDVWISRKGRPFYAFLNIPYAEPPVGELRFKDPIPARSWEGVRDATTLPPVCIHFDEKLFGQEDCLYLNIYTPKLTNITRVPVIVFTYGGRFMYGNALPDRYGPHYFMDKDVILITYHYRLGALGFLSTEDEVIPGNYGLKDHIAVLQWVQNYIEDFGGDKNRVTVCGGSSGGVTASLGLLSPLAKGLFHRVITQSATPLYSGIPGNARLTAWKFASFVGCDDENVKTSEALLSCLKNKPAEELASNYEKIFTGDFNLGWVPVIENEKVPGAFLIDEPVKLIQRNSDIPMIIGINSDEGGMNALYAYKRKSVVEELDLNYKKHFPLLFGYGIRITNTTQLDEISEKLKNRYFGAKKISENMRGYGDLFTAMIYLQRLKETVNSYKGPKYVYYYAHKNKQSFARWYAPEFDVDLGVIHGDELISMYNWSCFIEPVTEGVDLVVSEKIVNLWTNFAAKGAPSYDDDVCDDDDNNKIVWRPNESLDIDYLHIEDGTFEMKSDFRKSEYDFLRNVFGPGHF